MQITSNRQRRDHQRGNRPWTIWQTLGVVLAVFTLASAPANGEDAAEVQRRMAQAAQFLASDELQGRGLGSVGIKKAAEFIADQFRSLGLVTDQFDGRPFQPFKVTVGAEMGSESACAFLSADSSGAVDSTVQLTIGDDYSPLAIGDDGEFNLPIAFVGYGITAPEAEYDDYADTDVNGKAVIVLRHEPQQNNPHSAFNGSEYSEHAPFRRKVSNAYQHGAAAVIFCTDAHEIKQRIGQWQKRIRAAEGEIAQAEQELAQVASTSANEKRQEIATLKEKLADYRTRLEEERDPILDFAAAGNSGDARGLPVLHCRRGVIDRLLTSSGHADLARIEERIDGTLEPQSCELPGWRIKGTVDIERQQVETSNVIAALEGRGPFAEETIVVGAHYDHLGRGGEGSAEPGSTEIHNGADDNASGVVALLELARALAARSEPLARRVVFVAFTGEERGLLGSSHFVNDAPYPLENSIAMLNFDMVGRMKDNALIIYGTETAAEFDDLLEATNARFGFDISKNAGGYGPSDHTSFYAKGIPVLHFFTGAHSDYHRPSDDFDLLNLAGMRRVTRFATQMVVQLANSPERLTYVEVQQQPIGDGRPNPRPYFGSIPDFANAGDGYAISGTGPGSPAAEGGLEAGDVIVRFGEFKIGNLEDFDGALRKYEAGEKIDVIVRRDGAEVKLQVTLDPPR